MTAFMKELKPTSLTDLMVGIALFRPGPMDFIPKFVRGKNGGAAITYTHPSLEPILKETYGCIVYQEQVMQIVRDLAGYSWGRSDLVRRAMSKKQADVMEEEKNSFIYGIEGEVPGCVKNGIPAQVAERIFDDMADFANYAFGKAHSVSYATIGYQTAWLKTYYPTEYMAALMTSVMDNTDKVGEYIGECKKMGLTVLPPDVNESFGHFTVTESGGEAAIRFGMNAIKNVGRHMTKAIVAEREKGGSYGSLTEFIDRMPSGDLNKRGVESLIKAGAFTSFGGHRSQYLNVYERFLSGASGARKNNIEGQMSLLDMDFGGEGQELYHDDLPNLPELPIKQLLADEKEVLGIYVSGHPMQEFEEQMRRYVTAYSTDFAQSEEDDMVEQQEHESTLQDGQRVAVGGIIGKKNVVYTRRDNKPMCFLTIEDIYGTLETVIFPNLYQTYAGELLEGRGVIIEGKVNLREERGNSLVADSIRILGKGEGDSGKEMSLWLKIPVGSGVAVEELMGILSRYGGETPVVIYDEKNDKRLRVTDKYWVNCDSEELLVKLGEVLGVGSVVFR